MNIIWIYTLLSVTVVSLISLIGIITLAINKKLLNQYLSVFVGLSIGALFGDVFIHLIPEIFADTDNPEKASLTILAGILIFFILEKILHWRHEHCLEHDSCKVHYHRIEPYGYLNLISDGIHNFIDGALIAASFMISVPLGFATTIAILLHEIPQEIGDFGVLIKAGFTKTKALLFNLASAGLSIFGAILTLTLSVNISEILIPLTAGGFIYIAGSDLVPELHKSNKPKAAVLQFITICIGISVMFLLTFIE